jgi:phage terminase large subunit-like protein
MASPTRRPLRTWSSCVSSSTSGSRASEPPAPPGALAVSATRRSERPDPGGIFAYLSGLRPRQLEGLARDWTIWSRADQQPPVEAQGGGDWTVWLVLGGRGAGKTRTGAEWVRGLAMGDAKAGVPPVGRIALVGETFADVRDVMVDGVSGLLAVHPRWERPVWEVGRRRLVWPNGAVAQAFSAEEPESLRGPQFDAAWCDELAKWPRAELAWDNLQFALRLGRRPREIVTTTPRPTPLLKRLAADPRTAVTRAATAANRYNLAPAFLDQVVGRYQGTRLGRQELDGEFVDERPDAFWSREKLDACRIAPVEPADLTRIVVAVDPPSGSGAASRCGIVAAGRMEDGSFAVIADATVSGARPEAWADAVAQLYRSLDADAVVVEVNQGGDMAESVLKTADAALPVLKVRASRGKHVRAEPISALYARGLVRHAGNFAALEDEMCLFGADGLADGRSPDRMDALVWALTALSDGERRRPRVRGF